MKPTLFNIQLSAYFDTHLPEVRRCSKNTVESYKNAFRLLFDFFEEKHKIPHYKIQYKNFTPMIIEEFMLWLQRTHNYTGASVKARLSALNSFLKYASRREMSALSAFTTVAGAEKPKVIKLLFPYFTLQEMGILLNLPNPNKRIEKRDLALLSLFYESGARAQELCNIKVGDVKFGNVTKVKLFGKGSKTREVPISDDVSNLIRYHIRENDLGDKREEPLFLSQLGKKMTTACVRNLIDKYVSMARKQHPKLFTEPKYSPHSFRHSKAVHMVESGTQIIYIRDFLGHATVQSTEVYAKVGQVALTKMLTERGKHSATSHAAVEKSVNSKYPDFLSSNKCL